MIINTKVSYNEITSTHDEFEKVLIKTNSIKDNPIQILSLKIACLILMPQSS